MQKRSRALTSIPSAAPSAPPRGAHLGRVTDPVPEGLLRRTMVRFGGGALVLGALFFGTAGTFAYWQAWLYLAVLFVPATFVLVYLMRRDPALLERRMRGREPLRTQRTIIGLSSAVLLLAFVLPGLDRRFGWSSVPSAVVIVADVLHLLGYLLFFLVLRENRHAARTVEVEEGQEVITTGPYRTVRHPMYVAVLLMYGCAPLALGSWWALVPTLALPFTLVARIRSEERLLEEELAGYREYMRKTRWRMIPGLW